MGLIGNSIYSARISTNKFLMRESFKKAGLNCPQYFLIKPKSNLSAIGKKIRYPSIVKPVDRSGSAGVSKVNSEQEFLFSARVAIENSLVKEAIVEEFIEGVEVSVEMISFKGVHYELAITDKETSGPPHFVELAHHQPSNLPADLQKEIFKETRKGLNALNIEFGASHSEFIVSSKGVFVTEIGARMGGDFIGSDLVFLSTGYDFLKDTILTALGIFEPPQKTLKKCSGVYFYSEKSKEVRSWIDQYPSNPIIFKAELNNEELIPLSQSSCRSGYFIYQDNKKLILKK
jgi:biotin carboxylase